MDLLRLGVAIVGCLLLASEGFSRPRVDFDYYIDPEGEFTDQVPIQDHDSVGGPSVSATWSSYGLNMVCNSYLVGDGYDYALAMEAHVIRPDGAPFGSATNDAYKPSLYIDARGFDPNPIDGAYKCLTDNYAEGVYLGQSVSFLYVTVLLPSSLDTVSSNYLHQNFDDYNREFIYQVKNQLGGNLLVPNLPVTESYSPVSNSCYRNPIQTASTSTNTLGTFKDNYWVNGSGTPGCAQDASCTTVATQTIRVSNIPVRTNEVIYGCSGVTVTPQ